MTVQEKLEKMLIEHGLVKRRAKEIIECVKHDFPSDAMDEHRWSDPAEDYPEILFSILWKSACYHVLKWIDENLPLAWFRPLFVEEDEKNPLSFANYLQRMKKE